MVAHPSARLGAVFAAYFLMSGIMLAFWPVWLSSRGLAAAEVGLALAGSNWVRILGILGAGHVADRLGNPRGLAVLLSGVAVLLLAAFALVHGFWPILGMMLLWGLVWPPLMPLIDGIAVRTAAERNLSYGRMRLWGSISFVAATVGGGALLARAGADGIFALALAASLGIALACYGLPRDERQAVAPAAPRQGAMLALLREPAFVLFLLATGLLQNSHAVFYGFGTLEWRAAGIDDRVIGLLWAEGVIAEIVLFACAPAVTRRLGVTGLFLVAAAAGLVRWGITASTHDVGWLVAAQLLHGITFGAAHLGAMHYLARAVPAAATASAQALYYALPQAAGMAATLMLAGALYDRFGAGAFWAMAALSGVGGAAALALWRHRRGSADPPG